MEWASASREDPRSAVPIRLGPAFPPYTDVQVEYVSNTSIPHMPEYSLRTARIAGKSNSTMSEPTKKRSLL